MLYLIAEHFQLKILYTPLIPYMVQLYETDENAYLEYLNPIATNFGQNYIPYINEKLFRERIIHDPVGVERVKESTAEGVSENLFSLLKVLLYKELD